MRFLADENFLLPSVELLWAAGHDVAIAARLMPGVPDTAIADSLAMIRTRVTILESARVRHRTLPGG